jgi:hypothetical protein
LVCVARIFLRGHQSITASSGDYRSQNNLRYLIERVEYVLLWDVIWIVAILPCYVQEQR